MQKFSSTDNWAVIWCKKGRGVEYYTTEEDRVEAELAMEDMCKPIGVANYQLIVPQEEFKKVVEEEMEAFGKELPLRTNTEEVSKKE